MGSAVEDYVKAIYKLSHDNERVTPSQVAERLGVTQAAVAKMVRRLQELKLVRYARGTGVELNRAGEKVALEVIRHHRLLELYLTQALGYSWDQVHEEAEKLEHVISEHFEDRIEELLGYPTHDPHGAPIPTREGRIPESDATSLSKLQPGDCGVIQSVSDGNPEMLSYLGKLGMYPGTNIEMIARDPYGGSFHIRIAGGDQAVGSELAQNVFVSIKEKSKG